MALRDITLGQYFPGSSPIHTLDPRAKLVAMICYIVALFVGRPMPRLAMSPSLNSFAARLAILIFRSAKAAHLLRYSLHRRRRW